MSGKNNMHWHGKIRIKPKFSDSNIPLVYKSDFNFGEYGEIEEKLVFSSWGDPHFGDLNFNLHSKIGQLKEQKYLFHEINILSDDEHTNLILDIQHLLFTPNKCIFLSEVNVFFDNFKYHEEKSPNEQLALNAIIEFDAINGLETVLYRLAKVHAIPYWHTTKEEVSFSTSQVDNGLVLNGIGKLHYFRTIKFNLYEGVKHSRFFAKTNKLSIETSVQLFIQSHFKDFVIYLKHQKKTNYHVITADDQMQTYCDFMGDFEGNSLLMDNILLIDNSLLMFGKLKIGKSENEFEYYHSCFTFNSCNHSFRMLLEVMDLNRNDYWNLQELNLEGIVCQDF